MVDNLTQYLQKEDNIVRVSANSWDGSQGSSRGTNFVLCSRTFTTIIQDTTFDNLKYVKEMAKDLKTLDNITIERSSAT